MTIELTVIRWLRTRPGSTRKEIEAAGGPGTQRALTRLLKKGFVTRSAPPGSHACRWTWVEAMGLPKDGRGKSEGTRWNVDMLNSRPEQIRVRLRNLRNLKFDENGRYHPNPKPATELERCWGVPRAVIE